MDTVSVLTFAFVVECNCRSLRVSPGSTLVACESEIMASGNWQNLTKLQKKGWLEQHITEAIDKIEHSGKENHQLAKGQVTRRNSSGKGRPIRFVGDRTVPCIRN
jgi:hypothetical protein